VGIAVVVAMLTVAGVELEATYEYLPKLGDTYGVYARSVNDHRSEKNDCDKDY
jgi:hypothetical protein